ncbi:VTT domain-containing protein [Candidatus Wolfebacteria bacterium]|nr:VTT domain-containing protein [Candidatus Wolfebacteria bacterium]
MENFLLIRQLADSNWIYLAIFFGIMVEGDALIFISFFLASYGYFKINGLFIVLFVGALVGDILWYYFGAWINSHHSFMGRLVRRVKMFDSHLIGRPFHMIFISKFVYGFHHLILMRAGALNFSLKRFFKYDLFSSAIWILSIGIFGYLSGASFLAMKKYLKFTEIGLLFVLIAFIIVEYFIRRKSEKEL